VSGFLIFWILSKKLSFKIIKPLWHPLILFVIALIISTIFSLNITKSLNQIYIYLIYILIFLVSTSLSSKEKPKITNAIILAGFIISLLSIYQYLFGFKHVLNYMSNQNITYEFGSDYLVRKRVFFPFVTPNALGGFLIIIIPLILEKRHLYPLLIPIFLALFFTKSLGAFLSLFLGIIVYLYMKEKINRKKFFALLTLLGIIILVFILRTQAKQEMLRPYFSLSMRLDYWRETFSLIKAYPLMGVGLGNFNITQSRYAHNFLLQLWAEMGLLGLISFIWLIIGYLKFVFTNLKTTTHKDHLTSLISANVIFLTHNLIDFTFFLPEVCLIWWVILGLSINQND
jgi:O-antigen ligase